MITAIVRAAIQLMPCQPDYEFVLMRGGSAPFAPGACGLCWHGKLWHARKFGRAPMPCSKCQCEDYLDTRKRNPDYRQLAAPGLHRKRVALDIIKRYDTWTRSGDDSIAGDTP